MKFAEHRRSLAPRSSVIAPRKVSWSCDSLAPSLVWSLEAQLAAQLAEHVGGPSWSASMRKKTFLRFATFDRSRKIPMFISFLPFGSLPETGQSRQIILESRRQRTGSPRKDLQKPETTRVVVQMAFAPRDDTQDIPLTLNENKSLKRSKCGLGKPRASNACSGEAGRVTPNIDFRNPSGKKRPEDLRVLELRRNRDLESQVCRR